MRPTTTITVVAAFFGLSLLRPAAADGAMCPDVAPVPPRPVASGNLAAGATEVTAEHAELVERGRSRFTGNVLVVRGPRTLAADEVIYDDAGQWARFRGHARYWDPSLYWAGERGEVRLAAREAELVAGRYRVATGDGHGSAARVLADRRDNVTWLEDVDYTTCPGEVPDWLLAARRIRLDHDAERGSARHVTLKLRGTPVLYVPYLSFPLSDRRKTGFLPPTLGNSNRSGFDLRVPFYWNLAPNYDATITPRVMADRGLMVGGQFRYLTRRAGSGQLDVELLPSDAELNDDTRSLLSLRHRQTFADGRGTARLLYNRVSDKEYFEDFGASLALASTRFLEQRLDVDYRATRWLAFARVQNYQTVDRSIPGVARPYKRLPQLYFSTWPQLLPGGVHTTLQSELTYFDREASVTGTRIHIEPAISRPWNGPGWFATPRVALEYTHYALDNDTDFPDDPSRVVPIATFDGGLFLERELRLGDTPLVHTFEPRLFYVFIPETEQGDIPNFDSGLFDFSFDQLFRPNRFSGRDRIGDTNQVSVALRSRLLDARNGSEWLRAGVGQIYYFADREVTLPGATPQRDDESELVAELAARLSAAWSASAALQWDPNSATTRKSALRLRYRPGGRRLVNLDYRRRVALTNIEQTDLSFRWPFGPTWSVVGRWNYSLADDRTLEAVLGAEYESCCWGVRLVARRFLSTTSGRFDNGVFLQLQLKGLGGVGGKAVSFLRRSIPGYEPTF